MASPSGHVFRARLPPKRPRPPQLSSSSSAPLLLGYDVAKYPPKVWTEEEKHWRRVALSPQGLFARAVPPERESASKVAHRFHELGLKETRHLPTEDDSLPATPQDSPPTTPVSRRQSAPAGELGPGRLSSWKDIQEKKDMFDLRMGLRVATLDVIPPPLGTDKVWPPGKKDRAPPTREEALKVYANFCEMLAMEGREPVSGGDADAAGDGEEAEDIPSESPRSQVGLACVSWMTFFTWVETSSYTDDIRRQKVFEALLKAAKAYFQNKANEEQRRRGVSLSMIFRWMWPFLSCNGLANAFAWICQEQLDKVRLPTPPVVAERERSDIERVFRAMDVQGKGYCTALDLAGGDHADYRVSMKNTIDEATVKRILGDTPIRLPQFLELMCEDSFRGTEASTEAVLRDGRRVVKHTRSAIDYAGWVLKGPTAEQAEQMRRADALETEVLRWRGRSRGGNRNQVMIQFFKELSQS